MLLILNKKMEAKINNISKHARKSGKSFRKSYQEVLGEAGIIYWLASELKFKVTLLHVAQLLQLLSFMSLQFFSPILPAWEKNSL